MLVTSIEVRKPDPAVQTEVFRSQMNVFRQLEKPQCTCVCALIQN